MAMEKFKVSPLPIPPFEYSKQYLDQLVRVLNLYFGQLDSLTPQQAQSYRADNFYGGLFSGDGYGLKLPHIAASDSTDQRTTNNTATVVKWDTLDSGYGWTLNSPGSATADYAGVYTIRYSLQLLNSANAIHFATVWLKKTSNSVTADVPNSATIFSIPAAKNNNTPSYTVGYSEATFSVDVGDEIELYWATDQANLLSPATDGVYIFHDAAQTTPFARPAIPSAIGSITFVSAIP